MKNTGKPFHLWLLLIFVPLALAGYVAMSQLTYKTGFPLDDAWIHQTYARNLALCGEWAFIPGAPSAGSTSPLWSFLLAAGYWVNLSPFLWVLMLGAVSLFLLAFLGERLFRNFFQGDEGNSLATKWSQVPWVGLLLVFEWHLVWAALSGMETALYAVVILGVLVFLSGKEIRAVWVGLLIGLAAWIRPDGITLLGPALLTAVMMLGTRRERVVRVLKIGGAFLLGFLPYLYFNYSLSGNVFPNTLFAKQAEYAVQLQTPLASRLASLFSLPLVGVGVLLLPGLIWQVVSWIKQRHWAGISAFLWWAGYTILYALRLPVTYQHGRYLMPAMPVYFIIAAAGTIHLLLLLGQKGKWGRLTRFAWACMIVLVGFSFYGLGASSYSEDVAIIESEMVTTARWINANTEPSALIAAHDIGAMGYFSDRQLVDLAGLISPEVIPFIRDEAELAEYLDEKNVEYLVTFPEWYPQLTRRGELIYRTQAKFSPKAGGENMTVYRWK